MLEMKACGRFDSAMSEKKGRGLLLEMMGDDGLGRCVLRGQQG